jgi:hypothetical protein
MQSLLDKEILYRRIVDDLEGLMESRFIEIDKIIPKRLDSRVNDGGREILDGFVGDVDTVLERLRLPLRIGVLGLLGWGDTVEKRNNRDVKVSSDRTSHSYHFLSDTNSYLLIGRQTKSGHNIDCDRINNKTKAKRKNL